MYIETIEIANVKPSELKKGHRIINIGVIESVDEYYNCYVILISPASKNTPITFSISSSVKIESKNGKPCIY